MRSLVIPAVVTLALAGLAAAATAGGVAAGPASRAPAAHRATTVPDWPVYHGNGRRLGYSAGMPAYHSGLHVIKKITLDGAVYGAPVVGAQRTIVATENNTVYAFSTRNKLLWKRHLGAPSPAAQRPCGNIDPLGITGTPAYLAGSKTVFVAAELSGNPPSHRLFGLNVATGAVKISRTLDLPGVDRAAMQQRGAIAIASRRIWVPFGGLAGDCGAYKGRVIGYALDGKGSPVSYTVPTAREAGIWTPPGPSADHSGRLYLAVGNGAAGRGDKYDYSDSVLKINKYGHRISSFSPSTWASDNEADLDLGSQGPALVGDWVFAAGKSGTAYVLRASNLGGIGGQVSKLNLCRSFGGTAVRGSTVYVPCTDGLRAVAIDSNGRMHVRWHAASNITGSPIVGAGRVWSLDTNAGVLHGLNPKTGGSNVTVSVGATNRFATLTPSVRRILIGTLSGLTVVGY